MVLHISSNEVPNYHYQPYGSFRLHPVNPYPVKLASFLNLSRVATQEQAVARKPDSATPWKVILYVAPKSPVVQYSLV